MPDINSPQSFMKIVEIDRYIGLPIFKHFTIIGYRFKKKTIFFIYFYLSYTIIQSITSSEMCSLYFTHPSTHTWSSGHTHTPGAVDTHTHLEQWTHTHTHTPGAVDTHTHTHTHTHRM